MTVQTFVPGQVEIKMTEAARKRQARRELERAAAGGIRLDLDESGCSGYMYELEFVDQPVAGDKRLRRGRRAAVRAGEMAEDDAQRPGNRYVKGKRQQPVQVPQPQRHRRMRLRRKLHRRRHGRGLICANASTSTEQRNRGGEP